MNSGKSRYLSGCRGMKVEIPYLFFHELFLFLVASQALLKYAIKINLCNKCSAAYIIGRSANANAHLLASGEIY